MRSLLVVEVPPTFDQNARFDAAAEPLAVEQLVAQLAVEALDDAVLPRTARRDECRSDKRTHRPIGYTKRLRSGRSTDPPDGTSHFLQS